MLVPLAPSQRRAEARARSRTRGPGRVNRAARWAIGALLIAGALLGLGTPALAATHPGAGHVHQIVLTAQVTPGPGVRAGESDSQRGRADTQQRSGDQQRSYRPARAPMYPAGAAGPAAGAGLRAALGRGERDKHRRNSW